MRYDGVETLVAIVDHGTFEAAAQSLHVTPSAVSQRIRALEQEVGTVVVRRTSPCEPTEAGAALVRLGRQVRLLEQEARSSLAERTTLTVAVNADSLATWFRDVFGPDVGVQLRVVVEDQAFSAELLRRGEALAAVTSDPQPVQGCRAEHLGSLRYRPAATPALRERFSSGNRLDWQRMPVVVFNAKDELQHDFLRERGVLQPDVVHLVPTSADFAEAVRRGLGWGMLPEPQLTDEVSPWPAAPTTTCTSTGSAGAWSRRRWPP